MVAWGPWAEGRHGEAGIPGREWMGQQAQKVQGTRCDTEEELPGFQQLGGGGGSVTFTVRRRGRKLRKIQWLLPDVQEHL